MTKSMGSQTITVTTSTTVGITSCPNFCTIILLRSPSTNADNIYIKLDDYTASSGNIILRPGEALSFDIADSLKLKMHMGYAVEKTDFFQTVAYVAAANAPTLEIDTFGIPMPKVMGVF